MMLWFEGKLRRLGGLLDRSVNVDSGCGTVRTDCMITQYGALSGMVYICLENVGYLSRDSRESSQVFVARFQTHEGRVCSALRFVSTCVAFF